MALLEVTTEAALSVLRRRMADFVEAQTAAFIERCLPDGRMPAFLAGCAVSPNDGIALARLLGWLDERGVASLAGHPTREMIRSVLRTIDGDSMATFSSYQLSELLLRYGAFDGNPLLEGFSAAELANLADGCDSSHIRMEDGKELGGRLNNYWAVLARCEWGRLQLGQITDPTLCDEALGRALAVLGANPLSYFDDHRDLAGRYDIYAVDALLFLEPMLPRIRREPQAAARLEAAQRQAVALIEGIALEGGVSVAWGRSINGHSQAMLIEAMALGLAHGWTSDPAAALTRIGDGFTALSGLFHDGLVDIQRNRGIERYRSTYRLFESTANLIGKVVYAVDALAEVAASQPDLVPATAAAAYPDADRWIPFDHEQAGVWFHRAEGVAFQLPVVAINDPASYLPFPHAPGLFENPCGNFHLSGAPRLLRDGRQYSSVGRPIAVRHQPHRLEVEWDGFTACDANPRSGHQVPWTPPWKSDCTRLAGRRCAVFTIAGRSLRVDEHWLFEDLPQAIQLDVAESGMPLRLVIDCPSPHVATIIPIHGLPDWHSVWGPLRRLHQLAVTPAREIRLTWTVEW